MKAAIASVTAQLARLFSRDRAKNGKRVLVNDILSIQVISAALIGGLAIASLYWGGQWVLQDNYGRWALQWTEELNELGSPLFLADDGEALIRLESYVERYPEIDRVAYFAKDGTALFSVDNTDDAEPVADLSASMLSDAVAVVGKRKPYLMRGGILDPRQFEILAPVWTESIPVDGLFDFDPASLQQDSQTELIGFIGIRLDFVMFHDRLLSNIRGAILILLGLLIVFGLYGRRTLRKALASISGLQKPIQELAKGNLGVKFEPAEHREISDIVEALETTATALSERDAELLELANHDSLTGLFNRRRFVEEFDKEITNALQQGYSSALFFIDLDQFKYVNDACGHPAGDRLLCKVADELKRSVRSDDIVARFGGDEFAILMRRTDADAAQACAESILANLRHMAHVEEDQVFHVHCSIGITMLTGDELRHDELINQADIACREAKMAGRNRMHLYEHSEDTVQRISADVGWMNRLRNAVDDDEFELRFQPINRIDTGETTHHEVLIRLQGDDGKMILPDTFLPAAVRFGLMSEIDFWMIRHAAKAYAEHSCRARRLKLAINLSANAFENDDLTKFVEDSFKEHDVEPSDIILEITESLAIRRPLHVEQKITALRALGCHFALDDFGTGYSSFSYLQKLHFDYIKIDGAFVQDILNNPVDQKMIKLIAEIGREAGMQTIAEYVQDAESLVLLGELGVDMAQGYFVGRPTKKPQLKSTPLTLSSRRAKRSSRQN
ncbi:MAG: EAL domain-containing protein [Gammaproteobacteria bacterium]|nr:EAL domain-containing protein [Gammaproteobacteria bacterium]MDH3750901.1 EAL domain-containing protein [Gammaproteobacteria bacterium]MDH3806349.1 EAL domain-containing protein [Gammaproteobacteria bacterium]